MQLFRHDHADRAREAASGDARGAQYRKLKGTQGSDLSADHSVTKQFEICER